MKKYSGNYTSKEQLLSEMDIIKRSWETAGEAKRSCARFSLPSPSSSRKARQAGHQHLPSPSVRQGWARELPGIQPAGPEPPALGWGSRTPFKGVLLQVPLCTSGLPLTFSLLILVKKNTVYYCHQVSRHQAFPSALQQRVLFCLHC